MAIINKSVFLTAFLLAASSVVNNVNAASVRGSEKKKQFLRNNNDIEELSRATRKLKSGKDDDKKSNGNGGNTTPGTPQNTPIPPTPSPVQVGPNLDDWIDQCSRNSRDIDDCVTLGNSQTTAFNCKMCLKSLAFTSADANNAGVLRCAQGGTCNGCSADDIRPFFACGLEVEAAFGGVPGDPQSITTPPNNPVVVTTPAPVVTPAPTMPPTNPTIDKRNCPAVYPESGNACVMIDGFVFKECAYPEHGPSARCGCSKGQPIWACTGYEYMSGGAAVIVTTTPADDVVVVVEKDDLTVIVEDIVNGGDVVIGDNGPVTTTTTTTTTTAVISSTTDTEPLCPPDFPDVGDACNTGGFKETSCCYDILPAGGAIGSRTCMCSDNGENENIGFQCTSGEMSPCAV